MNPPPAPLCPIMPAYPHEAQGEIDNRNPRLQRCVQRWPWSGWEDMQPHAGRNCGFCRAATTRNPGPGGRGGCSLSDCCGGASCLRVSLSPKYRSGGCGLSVWLGLLKRAESGGVSDRDVLKTESLARFQRRHRRDHSPIRQASDAGPVFSGRQLVWLRPSGTNGSPGLVAQQLHPPPRLS